jgi:hypothetical protein
MEEVEGKGREGKGREGKGREGKGMPLEGTWQDKEGGNAFMLSHKRQSSKSFITDCTHPATRSTR